jgi:NADH dehydrogenase FAD-containing subunit
VRSFHRQNTHSSYTERVSGGSYGGISTVHNVLKHILPILPDKNTYKVILVSKSSHAICRPACPRALISDDMFNQEKLFVSIPAQFEQYGSSFKFINGTVTELNHDRRSVSIEVTGTVEHIDYHALIIATGASTHSPLFGFNRDKDFLRASWIAFREALPSAKSIVIAGSGPTGVETAGELGEYCNGLAGWFSSKLVNLKVTITLVGAGKNLLPNLRPAIANDAESYLAKVGVTVVKETRVLNVVAQGNQTSTQEGKSSICQGAGIDDVAAKATISLDNGTTIEADLYIPAFGSRPNTSFVTDRSLLGDDRRIVTDATLRVRAAGPRITPWGMPPPTPNPPSTNSWLPYLY